MLACRPRPAHRLASSASLRLSVFVVVLGASACSPGSDGGSPSGAAGTSGGGGTSGTAGNTGGSSAGSGGTGGSAAAGTTGAAGSIGGQGGTTGRGGTGGGSAGSNGGAMAGAGTTGVAGSGGAAGRGGTTGAAGSGAGTGGAAGGSRGGATAGTGGGAAGAGGTVVATTCNGGPPSPPSGGANFPFPQHRASSSCIYPPTCSDGDAQMGWAAYKNALVVADGSGDGSMRVQRDSGNGNDSVSEGIAYGMLFAAYMNDKTTFDALWKYEQKHLDTHGLMNWQIAANGNTAGRNSATDADEDMAFALLMADKQWGGYTTTATDILTTIAANDFGTDGTIKGGDTYVAVNPSYLAPAFYRVFAAYTGGARWTTILDKSYEILAMVQNATSGLVPDWSAGPGTNTNYGYDATRTPFRVAVDVCWSGDMRGKTFSQKIGAFFGQIGAANIGDGYTVTGTKTSSNHNATFDAGPGSGAHRRGARFAQAARP